MLVFKLIENSSSVLLLLCLFLFLTKKLSFSFASLRSLSVFLEKQLKFGLKT